MTNARMQYFAAPWHLAIAVIVATLLLAGMATSVLADSQATFTFKNNTGQRVNDLHMEFNTAVNVTDKGVFPNLSDNNTNKPTLSGAAVAPAATTTISVTGQANKTHLKKWWWTLDGQQVGPTNKGCKAPDCTSP